MKTAAAIAIAVLGTFAIATPAHAGKKTKSAKKTKAKKQDAKAQEAAAPRRLCDELGLGLALATPSGEPDSDADADAAEPARPAVSLDEAVAASAVAFDLSRLDDRTATMPSGEAPIRIAAQPLSEAQVSGVIKSHMGALEYCWRKLPAAQRTGGAIALKLTIDPRGGVTDVAVGGDPPAALASCVAKAAKRWSFPVADATTEVDYPIALQ